MRTPSDYSRARFGMLLITLAVLLGGTGLLDYTGRYLDRAIFVWMTDLLLAQVLIVAVLSVPTRRRGTALAIRLLVAAAIGAQVLAVLFDHSAMRVAAQAFGLLCVGGTIAVVLRFLMGARRADAEAIYAAVCVFLLMGVFWAMLYASIGRLEPLAFSTSSGDPPGMGNAAGSSTAIYFSFVTLTTLGYGDITPVTAAARTATALEALAGQVYLVVLVARLVGINVAQSMPTDRDPNG
jgi:voltage-gated potassium channel